MDDLKRAKYADLLSSHIFVPVAIESTGVFGINTLSFVKCLGKRLSRHSGDPKSTSCLSIAVQRGNAISIVAARLPQPIWTLHKLHYLLYLHLSVFIIILK